jgi:hypothetical protein
VTIENNNIDKNRLISTVKKLLTLAQSPNSSIKNIIKRLLLWKSIEMAV